jgi:hypothetical protein
MKSALAMVGLMFAAVSAMPQTPPQAPPRDVPKLATIGSAVVSGTVVADDELRTPLRRAFVTLWRSDIEDIRSTTTDDQGRYVFDHLPPASYTLGASKGAYLTMSYGVPKPGMPSSPVVLAEGEKFSAKPIALWRGAVIAGRLTDRHGQPVANATVEANQFVVVNGERRRRSSSRETFATTNGHGDYRIYGLMPGEYLVSSAPPPSAIQGEATAAELAWASRGTGAAPAPARVFTYAPTMFPGTADAAAGVVITLDRGEERLGVNFAMQLVPVSRVSGKVVGADGAAVPNLTVFCWATNPNAMLAPSGLPISRTGGDGAFVCPQLPPGQYTLAVRSASRVMPDPAARAVPGLEWAVADVTAAGQDIPNIVLRLQSGQQISGQVISKSVASAASVDPARVQVRLTPGVTAPPIAGSSNATAGPDGALKIDGIVPGTYRVTATAPGGWFLRSAVLAGKDVADVPFDIAAGQNLSGLVVTLTDTPTELSGVLNDGDGRPAPQLYVVVFATDKTLWTAGRRVRSVRSGENGSYTITGLPPGEYYLCALTELDTALQYEGEYLGQLIPASIKIALGEGEKKQQNLQIRK